MGKQSYEGYEIHTVKVVGVSFYEVLTQTGRLIGQFDSYRDAVLFVDKRIKTINGH